MGVYIFKSVHTDAIKIGHYKKNNAWSRVAVSYTHLTLPTTPYV